MNDLAAQALAIYHRFPEVFSLAALILFGGALIGLMDLLKRLLGR